MVAAAVELGLAGPGADPDYDDKYGLDNPGVNKYCFVYTYNLMHVRMYVRMVCWRAGDVV